MSWGIFFMDGVGCSTSDRAPRMHAIFGRLCREFPRCWLNSISGKAVTLACSKVHRRGDGVAVLTQALKEDHAVNMIAENSISTELVRRVRLPFKPGELVDRPPQWQT